MRPLSLLLAVHHDLPFGEDDAIMARATDQAYRPLLEALWAFPKIRMALHLGGALPEWLDGRDAPFLERLRALVARGQVEVLGGAYGGAVLHAVPERDALYLLDLTQTWVRQVFGAAPRTAWLTEGAWDSSLPRLLSRAGLQLTFLDEALVRGAGPARPDGWYVAEREGAGVGILPVHRRISSMIPWSPPRQVIGELQAAAAAGQKQVVVAIPGEQLGLHPHALRWCWARDRGWIRRFFEMLIAEDFWLKTTLPSAVLQRTRPAGRVFPIAGTPPDNGLASLDVTQGRALTGLLDAAREGAEVAVAAEPWLEGPPWETFLVRYDEANRLHKHMLRTSLAIHRAWRRLKEPVDGAGGNPVLDAARRALVRGQGAAAYHTAASGSLLRGQVRHRAWTALMEADAAARGILGETERFGHEIADHDCDGQREVMVNTPMYFAVVRPAGGGTLSELGFFGLGNLLNTLSRREELWHAELSHDSALPMLIEDEEAAYQEATGGVLDDEGTDPTSDDTNTNSVTGTGGTSTNTGTGREGEAPTGPVHGAPPAIRRPPPLPPLVGDLESRLSVDRYRRAAFHARFLGVQTGLLNLQRGQHPELGDFVDTGWQLIDVLDGNDDEIQVKVAREGVVLEGEHQRLIRVACDYRFFRDRPDVEVRYELTNRLAEPFHGRFAVEINLNLDSEVGVRFFEIPGTGVWPIELAWEERGISQVHLVLPDHRRRLRICSGQPAHAYCYPIEIPVRTRLGYTSGFQGNCVVLAWDVSLWGDEKTGFQLSLELEEEG